MAIVEQFEELVAWQKARELTRSVYGVSRTGQFARDYGLAQQVQRASASVMANIAEGFERSGQGEFPHFLSIAKGSCGEVRSHLYVALDAGYLSEADFKMLTSLALEVSRIISGLRASVQQSRRDNKAQRQGAGLDF